MLFHHFPPLVETICVPWKLRTWRLLDCCITGQHSIRLPFANWWKRQSQHLASVRMDCSLVRSILEYASVVFANLPNYLSQDLERIQRRALAIIFPLIPYVNTLTRAGILTLQEHRTTASTKFVQEVSSENSLYPLIHKSIISQASHYNLRPKPNPN